MPTNRLFPSLKNVDRGVSGDTAVVDVDTRRLNSPADGEDRPHGRVPFDDIFEHRLQEALQGHLHVVDQVIDDLVGADVDPLLVGEGRARRSPAWC